MKTAVQWMDGNIQNGNTTAIRHQGDKEVIIENYTVKRFIERIMCECFHLRLWLFQRHGLFQFQALLCSFVW